MAEAKPFASLSSSLLARKGHARPAMRPQAYGFPGNPGPGDDLGWNDMSGGLPSPEEAAPQRKPLPLTPATTIDAEAAGEPPVVAQRRELARELAAEPVPVPVEDAGPADISAPARSLPEIAIRRAHAAVAARRGKAAFTLRLDADRHLRLKLASAMERCSAQQLVTQALDAFFEAKPELDALVRQLPPVEAGPKDEQGN